MSDWIKGNYLKSVQKSLVNNITFKNDDQEA
jgi:hypothetical protein